MFSPSFFKNVWWADKTDEDQKVYLFLNHKNDTMRQAYSAYKNTNFSRDITGTILETYDTFAAKWKTLLQESYAFSQTQHHPVYNGTHIWNRLPLSLRRKWKRGQIDSTDPYLLLVNCCISKLMYDFFEVEQSNALWPIYEAHGLAPAEFNARYFRVPGPSDTCFYFNLPSIWEQLNGFNEIEGKWNAFSHFLSRMTHVLKLPTVSLPSISNVTVSVPTNTEIEQRIRNVDRTQRFLCSYTQTLNNSEVDSDNIIHQAKLTEIGYIYNNTELYTDPNTYEETHAIASDIIPKVLTTNHSDYRFDYYTRNQDHSILNVDIDYLQTVNVTTDSNLSLQEEFLVPEENVTYEIFSTGMIDDPRPIQEQLYDLSETQYRSFYNALRYAEEYIIYLANDEIQIETYLDEFYYRAVPSTVIIDNHTVGTIGSSLRIAFYESIKEYLINYLKNALQYNADHVGDLAYRSEIRKLTYNEIIELKQSEEAAETLKYNLTTFNPSDPLQSDILQMFDDRHTTRLGPNTSEIHLRSNIQTPFHYFQVSPTLSKIEYNYTETPRITTMQQRWNEVSLFPSSYDSNFGCLLENTCARRYVNNGSSSNHIRRPITYGESIELYKSQTPYWSVGEPIPVIGNYGRDYITDNQYRQTVGLDPVLLETQDFVWNKLSTPYEGPNRNTLSIPSVIEKNIHIPFIDILSNDMDRIIPRVLTGDTFLELSVTLHRFNTMFHEWSSANKLQTQQLREEQGNYYIRDQNSRCGHSEFELRNPFSSEIEPTYYRNIVTDISSEVEQSGFDDITLFPSLNNDFRNQRQNMYKMWCGYPIISNNSLLSFPNKINTPSDRVVLYNTLPWYKRYRQATPIIRIQQPNQFSVSPTFDVQFHYYGFAFTPKFNNDLIQKNAFGRWFKAVQAFDNNHIDKEDTSISIETIKKVFDIRFNGFNGSKLIKDRGLEDSACRTIYASHYPSQLASIDWRNNLQIQRYVDGGGLWLGTDSIALRLQQVGVNPFTISRIEIPSSITTDTLKSIPQFDTNFCLSGENRYPVLVEYPSVWSGLHGTITQQDSFAPFINTIERPCIIWKTPSGINEQRYNKFLFQSILFDVTGDEIGPQKDGTYYHDKYNYEYGMRVTEDNMYGIQFGLGNWNKQPTGYFDFGASTNTKDRFFKFKASQQVNAINTDVEKHITIDFDFTWQNKLIIRDGLMFTRYIR